MDLLKNIKLSEEEYEFLQIAWCDDGSEGFIIRDEGYAIKIFHNNFGHDDFSIDEIEEIRENKFGKLELLYSMRNRLGNRFYPIATYSYQGEFVGYKGKWFSYPLFEFSCLSDEENIFYLKKIREKLERFHELGIVYGDLKDNNVLLDEVHQDVIFVDMDNIQIGDYSIDMMSSFMQDFVSNYHGVDWKLDSYMMNLLTLERLFSCLKWYYEVLEKLKLGYLPKELFKKNYASAKKLVREMNFVDRKYSGKYFIDMI